jgi:cytochrome c-type biogenesis protein CcmF
MPEKRRYANRGQVTSETAIQSSFLRDIYINLGELNDQDQWILRLQSNYFISLIWGGIMIMLLGILVFLRKIKHAAD